MLSAFKIILIISISFLMSNDRGWVHPQTGWEVITNESMSFYLINEAYLDNAQLQNEQQDVIGVFFNNQNIGWEFYAAQITIIPATGNNGSLPTYPTNGDSITFKIYDASEDYILDAFSEHNIPLWEEHSFVNIQSIYSCSSDFPILEGGICITSCMGVPNLDGQINILDLTEIISLIINCENPEICYDNYLECMDYDSNQIIDILDLILILNIIL